MLNRNIIYYSAAIVVGSYFLFLGLASVRNVLAPLVTAVILSLMVLPLAHIMETRIKRVYSSLINTFLLFLISVGLIALLSFQVKTFVDDWPKIKETMKPKIEQLKTFVLENTPVKESDINTSEEGGSSSLIGSGSNNGEMAVGVLGSIFGFAGLYLLTFVYIFFLLNYRRRFKIFLFRLFPDDKKEETNQILSESAKVVQQYLAGKSILILLLAIFYSIGLGISGVNNFILISFIAALFDLIPYVGNIVGFAMAMAFGYVSSGETAVLIGIIITFTIAQFVQNYLFQPYIVGEKVDLHPFFTVLVVIVGNAVWGVIGMILSIPVMAVITIVFLHVPFLKPFGFLFSNKKVEDEEG